MPQNLRAQRLKPLFPNTSVSSLVHADADSTGAICKDREDLLNVPRPLDRGRLGLGRAEATAATAKAAKVFGSEFKVSELLPYHSTSLPCPAMRLRAGEVAADDVANAICAAEFAVYEPESKF